MFYYVELEDLKRNLMGCDHAFVFQTCGHAFFFFRIWLKGQACQIFSESLCYCGGIEL
jgi:hypothetical protein